MTGNLAAGEGPQRKAVATPGMSGADSGRGDLDGDMIELVGDEDMMLLLLRKHSNAGP